MTCGIYKLVFPNTIKVYIGQSIDIETRYKKHLSCMTSGISALKLQNAFNTYGKPSLEILEECSIKELDSLENEIIEIYNSVLEGFNTLDCAGGLPDNSGPNNGMSRYSEDSIVEVFDILIENKYSNFSEIIERTGVSNGVISGISAGTAHTWLKDKFPDKYSILMEQKATRKHKPKPILSEIQSSKAKGIIHPKVVSPEGEVFELDNVRAFAREHSLNQGNLHSLLVGRAKSVKGWKLQIQ